MKFILVEQTGCVLFCLSLHAAFYSPWIELLHCYHVTHIDIFLLVSRPYLRSVNATSWSPSIQTLNVARRTCQNSFYLPHPKYKHRQSCAKCLFPAPGQNRSSTREQMSYVWAGRESADASLSWTLTELWAGGKRLSCIHTHCYFLCSVFCKKQELLLARCITYGSSSFNRVKNW